MKENRKLDAFYGDFIKTDGERYPSTLTFNVVAEDIIKMKVRYDRVTIDEPLGFPFSIPGNYKRIR
jgi:hypothetical protein